MRNLTGLRGLRLILLSITGGVMSVLALSCGTERTPTFSVSPSVTALIFSVDGKKAYSDQIETNAEFTISTNQRDWNVELSEPDSWLSIMEYEERFTLSAAENTALESRGPITVTVSSGNAAEIVMEVTQEGVSSTLPRIYMAGRYAVASEESESSAVLKDGELFILGKYGNDGTEITGIAVQGGEVYASGYSVDDGKTKALYWKGGDEIYLPQTGGMAYAYDIAVPSSDRYTIGADYYPSEDGTATLYDNVYWKNVEKIILVEGTGSGASVNFDIRNIAVSGSDVYAAGIESRTGNGTAMQRLVYWKNGEPSVIEENDGEPINPLSVELVVSGSDIYISATLSDNGAPYGGYWKNGVFTRLLIDGNNADIIAMDAEGDDLYIIGMFYDTSERTNKNFLWKNGDVTIINTQSETEGYSVVLYDMAVHEGRALISGIDGDYAGRKGNTCYWIDGVTKVVVDVPLTAGIFIPEFIAVAN